MKIQDLHLGATMYTPATVSLLKAQTLVQCVEYVDLKSLVFCLEDSLLESQVEPALKNIRRILLSFKSEQVQRKALVYIRPRNIRMAQEILSWGLNSCFDGFVLPKFSLSPEWFEILESEAFSVMPTFEDKEYFDGGYRKEVLSALIGYSKKIPCIRIGGNDLLSCLNIRRPRAHTIYDTPVGALISTLVGEFTPHGFNFSSPVFEHFSNIDVLEKEVGLDVIQGLFAKTIIHPCQISHIQSLYKVDQSELNEAEIIIAKNSVDPGGVYNSGNGSMLEPATHLRWAQRTIDRFKIYGIKETLNMAILVG